MRALYFHIGLHKTGTTYLQRLILENRELFLQAGLGLAPYLHPREGNHYPFLQALRAEDFRPEAFRRLLGEVAGAPGEAVLLSAEELCWLVARPEHAAALRDAAARHFVPRVVIFVRRQDYLKESIFTQAVKTWYSGPIQDETHYDYDHDGRVRAIEAIFGRENVRVVLYRDGGDNDLLGGLLAALGIALDRAALRPIPPQNVSMHRRQVLFMSQLPKSPRAQQDRRHMQYARQVAAALQRSGAVADDGGRFLMSPRERHALVAAHQAGNRALVARYAIADAEHFLALPDPDAPWAPPAPITAAERGAALRAVLRAFCARRNLARALQDSAWAGRAFLRMARSS